MVVPCRIRVAVLPNLSYDFILVSHLYSPEEVLVVCKSPGMYIQPMHSYTDQYSLLHTPMQAGLPSSSCLPCNGNTEKIDCPFFQGSHRGLPLLMIRFDEGEDVFGGDVRQDVMCGTEDVPSV